MRGRVGHGTCSSCGDRRLPKAVRSRYYASARGRPPLHGNVLDSFDTGCWAITYLRREVSRFIANESSSQGRHADRRAGAWLQEVEQICDPEALALTIGRTNCASLEEDPIIRECSGHGRSEIIVIEKFRGAYPTLATSKRTPHPISTTMLS